jgi:nicotinamidase-related amidase
MINDLLSLPFAFKIATQDFHPANHISFASNHPGAKPFETFIDMKNLVGGKPEETMKQRLWPVHCVQGTIGSDIIDEIDKSEVDMTIRKGMDSRVEMYSAFSDSFGNLTAGQGGVSHDLESILKEKQISHVYVVGLAGDYCVKATAVDAAKAGFESYVIEEAQRCVDHSQGWNDAKSDFEKMRVGVISIVGDEVKMVKNM